MERVGPRTRQSNVYLLGFMGCGKSAVGRRLAQVLEREFVDLDFMVEARAGKPIPEIFVGAGEPGFRDLESACLSEVAGRQSLVVALGGGAILREENYQLIVSSGVSVFLKVRPTILLARLSDAGARPLLLGLDHETRLARVRKMLRRRRPLYEKADIIITNEGSVDEAVKVTMTELQRLWKSSE